MLLMCFTVALMIFAIVTVLIDMNHLYKPCFACARGFLGIT